MGVYKQEFIHLYMAYMTFLVECTVQLNIFMAIAPCERDFADFLKCPPRLRDRFTIFIAQNVNTVLFAEYFQKRKRTYNQGRFGSVPGPDHDIYPVKELAVGWQADLSTLLFCVSSGSLNRDHSECRGFDTNDNTDS